MENYSETGTDTEKDILNLLTDILFEKMNRFSCSLSADFKKENNTW
jgi:hypothetical protein